MTPYQMAKKECCNFAPDGTCLSRDTMLAYFQTENIDCVLSCGEQCRYFEQCILPIANQPSPLDDEGLQNRRAKSRTAYCKKHGIMKTNHVCDCGKPRAANARYCLSCAIRSLRTLKKAVRG